jgi:hypothetical protein
MIERVIFTVLFSLVYICAVVAAQGADDALANEQIDNVLSKYGSGSSSIGNFRTPDFSDDEFPSDSKSWEANLNSEHFSGSDSSIPLRDEDRNSDVSIPLSYGDVDREDSVNSFPIREGASGNNDFDLSIPIRGRASDDALSTPFRDEDSERTRASDRTDSEIPTSRVGDEGTGKTDSDLLIPLNDGDADKEDSDLSTQISDEKIDNIDSDISVPKEEDGADKSDSRVSTPIRDEASVETNFERSVPIRDEVADKSDANVAGSDKTINFIVPIFKVAKSEVESEGSRRVRESPQFFGHPESDSSSSTNDEGTYIDLDPVNTDAVAKKSKSGPHIRIKVGANGGRGRESEEEKIAALVEASKLAKQSMQNLKVQFCTSYLEQV